MLYFEQLFAEDNARMACDLLNTGESCPYRSTPVDEDFYFMGLDQQSETHKQSLIPDSGSSQDLPPKAIECTTPNTACEPHQDSKRAKKTVSWKKYGDFIVDSESLFKPSRTSRKPILPNKLDPKYPKGQYPTKNLLQNFKGAHLDYLEMHFPLKDLRRMEALKPLYARNTMSMKAYQKLYEMTQFQDIFEQMFAEKYLYRALMLSRSELTAKKNHVGKLEVFEEAFRTKQFKSIN